MKRISLFLSVTLIILLSACSPQAAPTATVAPPPTTVPASPPPATVAPTTAAPGPTAAATTASPTTSGACTDAAAFVADVTIPDYSHLDQREAFTKTWRVKNTGTCTWTSDYKAVYSRGDTLSAPMSIPLANTPPQGTLDISSDMTTPAQDGRFEIFYQLTNGTGDAMPIDAGDSLWALISVGKVVVVAPATPTTSASTVPVSNGSGGPGLSTASCVSQGNADFLTQTLTLINAARAANSLPALTLNDDLSTAAQSHSEDMACNSFLSHNGWNGSTPDSRIAAAGYTASITRENIYAQPPQFGGNPQAAVDWWMSDPIHRDAILNSQVKEIGVGYAAYSRSELGGYFTVDFAAP